MDGLLLRYSRELPRNIQNRLTSGASVVFLALGVGLLVLRSVDLWRNPYQAGRVWQSFDIARELERVHGVPWATELSPMTGGLRPAPFVQEFPFPQYAVLLLRRLSSLSIAESGQAIAITTAVLAAVVWLLYSRTLPLSAGQRLFAGGLIFFVPGFLRFGAVAVPDAFSFLIDLAGVCLIAMGRRRKQDMLVAWGAALIGLAVLAKTTALPAAAMVGLALAIERRWRAVITMAAATLPGLAWAVLGHEVNQAAVSVNYFARLATIREYWWNPRLYFDPWWARSVLFSVYDALGLLGILLFVWALAAARKRRFESLLLTLPAAITILVFNYHSASHHYYALIWLPFVLVAGVELTMERWRTPVLATAMALAVAGLGERDAGLVERFAARQPGAAAPLFHHSTPVSDSPAASRAALALLKTEGVSYVAYLGNTWMPFLDLDMRGWIVDAPAIDQRLSRVPASVIRAQERFQLSADWFRDRVERGLEAVLIERGGPFDNPELIGWAREAGLRPAGVQPPGFIVLRVAYGRSAPQAGSGPLRASITGIGMA